MTGRPKGARLLGVRAVIAQSYERIHRSNLVGMGIVPLEFLPGQSPASLGLAGEEMLLDRRPARLRFEPAARPADHGRVSRRKDGQTGEFKVRVRIDTQSEAAYFRHGGILPYVLRGLLA